MPLPFLLCSEVRPTKPRAIGSPPARSVLRPAAEGLLPSVYAPVAVASGRTLGDNPLQSRALLIDILDLEIEDSRALGRERNRTIRDHVHPLLAGDCRRQPGRAKFQILVGAY